MISENPYQDFVAIHEQMREIASNLSGKEKYCVSIGTTWIVNETVMRLLETDTEAAALINKAEREGLDRVESASLTLIFAVAARRAVVDYARRKRASKRPTSRNRIDLDEGGIALADRDRDALIEIDAAVDALDALPKAQREVVLLRFFAGLTVEETAEVLGVSITTIKECWTKAAATLRSKLKDYQS